MTADVEAPQQNHERHMCLLLTLRRAYKDARKYATDSLASDRLGDTIDLQLEIAEVH